MNYRHIKNFLAKFSRWPFHPQWLLAKGANADFRYVGAQAHGRVLDIGCANQYMRKHIDSSCEYIGLDYYQTAVHWYGTRPGVYGDAHGLPFPNQSMDTVLLLDVLEHLAAPEECLREAVRVLKPGGKLIIKAPFLYPLHDAPRDFQRWTGYGLTQAAQRHGLLVEQVTPLGQPLETAALLSNLALASTALHWLARKSPLLLLALVFPLVILLNNIAAWLFSVPGAGETHMPYSYRAIFAKPALEHLHSTLNF